MKRDTSIVLLLTLQNAIAFTNKAPISPFIITNTKPNHRHQSCTNRIKLQMSSFPLDDENETTSSSMDQFFQEIQNTKPLIKTESNLCNQELLLNAVLLTSAFGFAIYTILNIDHEMSRGWTHAEILSRIPMDNWKGYEDSLSDKPIVTKTMINVIIYLLGDWLSQTLFQKRNILDFDSKRTLRNGFIGLCFGPIVHQYYEFSDYILPVDVGINRVYKIIMDQTIYLTTKVSVYIVAVGLLAGEDYKDCIENVRIKIKNVVFTAWKFWPLVHCVTYSVIPAQHRILWVNCVDLVWNAILALMAGKKEDVEDNGEAFVAIEDSFVLNNVTGVMGESVEVRDIPMDIVCNDTLLGYSTIGNDTGSEINLTPVR